MEAAGVSDAANAGVDSFVVDAAGSALPIGIVDARVGTDISVVVDWFVNVAGSVAAIGAIGAIVGTAVDAGDCWPVDIAVSVLV